MTLKEKFKKANDTVWLRNETVLEKIADEFAIGFADWIRVCILKRRSYDFENIENLLEIYKEEKGL